MGRWQIKKHQESVFYLDNNHIAKIFLMELFWNSGACRKPCNFQKKAQTINFSYFLSSSALSIVVATHLPCPVAGVAPVFQEQLAHRLGKKNFLFQIIVYAMIVGGCS